MPDRVACHPLKLACSPPPRSVPRHEVQATWYPRGAKGEEGLDWAGSHVVHSDVFALILSRALHCLGSITTTTNLNTTTTAHHLQCSPSSLSTHSHQNCSPPLATHHHLQARDDMEAMRVQNTLTSARERDLALLALSAPAVPPADNADQADADSIDEHAEIDAMAVDDGTPANPPSATFVYSPDDSAAMDEGPAPEPPSATTAKPSTAPVAPSAPTEPTVARETESSSVATTAEPPSASLPAHVAPSAPTEPDGSPRPRRRARQGGRHYCSLC